MSLVFMFRVPGDVISLRLVHRTAVDRMAEHPDQIDTAAVFARAELVNVS